VSEVHFSPGGHRIATVTSEIKPIDDRDVLFMGTHIVKSVERSIVTREGVRLLNPDDTLGALTLPMDLPLNNCWTERTIEGGQAVVREFQVFDRHDSFPTHTPVGTRPVRAVRETLRVGHEPPRVSEWRYAEDVGIYRFLQRLVGTRPGAMREDPGTSVFSGVLVEYQPGDADPDS